MKKLHTEKYSKAISVSRAELSCLDQNDEPLQTGYWAAFKQRFGWQALAFLVDCSEHSYPVLMLSRRLMPMLNMVYVPLGPSLPEPETAREEFLEMLTGAIASGTDQAGSSLLPAGSFVIRYDLPWHADGLGNLPPSLVESGAVNKAVMDIQPASTVLLDLRRSEDEILAAMKSKTRYNIRLSAKKGIQVEEAGEEKLAEWYSLYQETGARDRIAMHSLAYCRGLFQVARQYRGKAPQFRLVLARSEGQLLAGVIVGFLGRRAWYPFGASSNRKRNLMPTYAVQWRAIQMAKERGCEIYDFCGIPPSSSPTHPMHGLFQFKIGFGGTIRNRCGCWDVAIKKARYTFYRSAERARRFYYQDLRKRGRVRAR